jgi:hypothetical protein
LNTNQLDYYIIYPYTKNDLTTHCIYITLYFNLNNLNYLSTNSVKKSQIVKNEFMHFVQNLVYLNYILLNIYFLIYQNNRNKLLIYINFGTSNKETIELSNQPTIYINSNFFCCFTKKLLNLYELSNHFFSYSYFY